MLYAQQVVDDQQSERGQANQSKAYERLKNIT
jgi:hypothetical protein